MAPARLLCSVLAEQVLNARDVRADHLPQLRRGRAGARAPQFPGSPGARAAPAQRLPGPPSHLHSVSPEDERGHRADPLRAGDGLQLVDVDFGEQGAGVLGGEREERAAARDQHGASRGHSREGGRGRRGARSRVCAHTLSDRRPNSGAIMRHGPHHEAEKSTRSCGKDGRL